MPGKCRSISEQFLQLVARGGLTRAGFGGRPIRPASHLEILAEVAHVLLGHRIGATVSALLRRPQVMAHAVQAYPQVRVARRAGLAASRLPRQRPFPSALPAMTCHGRECTNERKTDKPVPPGPKHVRSAQPDETRDPPPQRT